MIILDLNRSSGQRFKNLLSAYELFYLKTQTSRKIFLFLLMHSHSSIDLKVRPTSFYSIQPVLRGGLSWAIITTATRALNETTERSHFFNISITQTGI